MASWHKCLTPPLAVRKTGRTRLNLDEQAKSNLMIESIEDGLCNIHGERKIVKRLNREPYRGSSSFATERIRILLDDGMSADIFFKDLNPENLLNKAQRVRNSGLESSRREFLMYKEVLVSLQLGTPKLYGYRWEPGENIYWIFLEDVGQMRLTQYGEFSLWVDAARWAARLHAVDKSGLMDKTDFLPNYDAEHFSACARRVEESLSEFGAQQQNLIYQALERYYEIVDYLKCLPLHLIHGDYFGNNVMIRPGEARETIAVIDWETAAFGPRCVDLVSINAGRWTPEQREIMSNAYTEQYEAETGQPIDMAALAKELGHVALYRALWWLGYWSKGNDAKSIKRWIKELATVMESISPN